MTNRKFLVTLIAAEELVNKMDNIFLFISHIVNSTMNSQELPDTPLDFYKDNEKLTLIKEGDYSYSDILTIAEQIIIDVGATLVPYDGMTVPF